jgi:uncharacterized protein
MKRDQLLKILRTHQPELLEMGALRIGLFGSFARDKADATSDVDILVDMAPPFTYDRYTRIKFFLEDLVDRPVDLVLPDTIRERIRPVIEKEVIYVT